MEDNKKTVEDVLNRMYNWKMESANLFADEIENFPIEAKKLLEKMSVKFGNCGWNEGKIFNQLRNTNHKIANILGYKWNEEKDKWIKI